MDMQELEQLYKKVLRTDEDFFRWNNPDLCNVHWTMVLSENFIPKAKVLHYYGISILKKLHVIDWEPEFPKIGKKEFADGSSGDNIYEFTTCLHDTLYRVLEKCGWSIHHISICPVIQMLLDKRLITYNDEGQFEFDQKQEEAIYELYHKEIGKLYGTSFQKHFKDWFSMLGQNTIENHLCIESSTVIANHDIGLLYSYYKSEPDAPSEEKELFFSILEQINNLYVVQYMHNAHGFVPGYGYCITLETGETVDNGGEFVSDAHISIISIISLGLMKVFLDLMKQKYPDMDWEVAACEKTA